MSDFFKIVKDKTQGFTIIPNKTLFDKNLSLKSTSLLMVMLALPPSWDMTMKGLSKLKKDGIDSIKSGIHELENAGYVTKKRLRNELGQVSGVEYTVYETLELNPEYNKNDKTENAENTQVTPKVEIPLQAKKQQKNTEKLSKEKNSSPKVDFPFVENPFVENPCQLNTKYKLNNNNINNLSINQDNINNINNNTYRCEDFDSIDTIRETIKQNIDYDYLAEDYSSRRDELDELVEIMAECVCCTEPALRVGKQNMDSEVVRSQFMKLDHEHIEYVLDSLATNTTRIKNMKAYLITSLYNAPMTISNHVASQVRCDIPNMVKSITPHQLE